MEHSIILVSLYSSYFVFIKKPSCLSFPEDQPSYVTTCCRLSIPSVVLDLLLHRSTCSKYKMHSTLYSRPGSSISSAMATWSYRRWGSRWHSSHVAFRRPCCMMLLERPSLLHFKDFTRRKLLLYVNGSINWKLAWHPSQL